MLSTLKLHCSFAKVARSLRVSKRVEPAFVLAMAVKYPRAVRTAMGMGFATRAVLAEAVVE